MPRTLALIAFLALSSIASAGEFKHQITGLFMPGREQDLRDVVAEIPNLKLVAVDFTNAEATFEYDPAKAFPAAKPDQVVARLDQLLRSASHGTFGARPLRTTPLDKLTLVEIQVAGLDCKACSLAAYEAVYKLDGVERATASFRDGKVTALIDPAKADRAKLEAALKQRGVTVAGP